MTDIQWAALIVGFVALVAPWVYRVITKRFPWEDV